jgi:D-beta-D-heptose 7-phosphate kinase/D-beta-D-heptose 1-phosphate adenosyltransferase
MEYQGDDFYHIPSHRRESFDVIGAGDTFLAVLSVFVYRGFSMLESIKMANKASGIAVSHKGTYVIKPEDIKPKTLVFTNGCFDILHPGHIEYLKKSKDLGDELVVGINSDYSIKKLKGDDRPINNQDHRKYMLESLPFDTNRPYKIHKTRYNNKRW